MRPSRVSTSKAARLPASTRRRPRGAAGDHLDGADVLAQLGHRHAVELELELLRDLARRQPDQAQPLGVHGQVQHRHALVPVQVRVDRVLGSAAMTSRTWWAMLAQTDGSGPTTRKAHRPDDRRPVQQPIDAHPRLGELAAGDVRLQLGDHPVALGGIRASRR